MTPNEARDLVRSRRVMMQVTDDLPVDGCRTYLVLVDRQQVGMVTPDKRGWMALRPVGGGVSVTGPWRKRSSAVRRLLRTYDMAAFEPSREGNP